MSEKNIVENIFLLHIINSNITGVLGFFCFHVMVATKMMGGHPT